MIFNNFYWFFIVYSLVFIYFLGDFHVFCIGFSLSFNDFVYQFSLFLSDVQWLSNDFYWFSTAFQYFFNEFSMGSSLIFIIFWTLFNDCLVIFNEFPFSFIDCCLISIKFHLFSSISYWFWIILQQFSMFMLMIFPCSHVNSVDFAAL